MGIQQRLSGWVESWRLDLSKERHGQCRQSLRPPVGERAEKGRICGRDGGSKERVCLFLNMGDSTACLYADGRDQAEREPDVGESEGNRSKIPERGLYPARWWRI